MADNCSICLNDLTQGDLAVQDGCRHIHHDVCIRQWLRSRSARRWFCPLCRARIKSIQTIPNTNLPEQRAAGEVAVNPEPPVHPQQGGRIENEGNVNEEPEVVILDPPPPPSISLPSTENERNQNNSQLMNAPSRSNQPAPFVRRPITYVNPTYGSQPTAVAVQGQRSQVLSNSSNLIVLQPVNFSPIPGPSTGAQSTRAVGRSIPGQSSNSQQQGSTSHVQGFSGVAESSTLSLNQGIETFVCPTCQLVFRLRNSLSRHIYRAHRNRLQCPSPACDRTFTDRSRLRRHLNNRHLE